MKSVMHNFAVNPDVKLPRSQFKMPFGHKFTGDANWLIPAFWQYVLPGDTMTVNPSLFARLSTPLFPIMDNMVLDIQWFFTPTRQYWQNYRKFHGEQDNPGDSISYTIPQLSGTQDSHGGADLTTTAGRTSALLNYLGVPHGIDATDVGINAELTRCYHHIYNHWYRDQNLINSVTFDTDDGPDTDTDYLLQRRGKRFDYFTQALPSPQRGSAVSLPLGTTAPIYGDGSSPFVHNATDATDRALNLMTTKNVETATAPSANDNLQWTTDSAKSGLVTDLTTATAANINDIREAFQVQRLLERDARSGTRLPEVLRGHFGVTFYDVTYRPEFLGGGSTPINIHPVVKTGWTDDVSAPPPAGDLAAFGTAGFSEQNSGFTKSFVEHGIVMGIVSVRADLTYQQGLNRFFSHQTRYDTAYPVLAHLGEQAILSKELYVDGTANDDDVFGYVPRYDEYRFNISRISGKFSSLVTVPLDSWHLSQEFASRPTLTQTFIEENTPLDRCVATPDEPHFIFDTFFDVTCARVLPTYGIPGRIDHF